MVAADDPGAAVNEGASIPGSITGSASDEVLEIHSDASESRTRWDAFVQYRMSDEVVLLYCSNSAASIIPGSFFASDEDWHDFGKLVQTIVPTKSLQRGSRSRLTWLMIVFVVAFTLVLFLYGYLSVLDDSGPFTAANQNLVLQRKPLCQVQIDFLVLPAERGIQLCQRRNTSCARIVMSP